MHIVSTPQYTSCNTKININLLGENDGLIVEVKEDSVNLLEKDEIEIKGTLLQFDNGRKLVDRSGERSIFDLDCFDNDFESTKDLNKVG